MLTPTLVVALVAVFAAVAMIAGSVTYLTLERSSMSPIRRRLQAAARPVGKALDVMNLSDTDDAALKRFTQFVPKSPKALGRLRKRLTFAGYHKPSHAITYSICELAFPAVAFLAVILVFGFARGMIYAILAAIIGYLIPGFYIARRVKKRQKAIQNGLPDALDLLIVCLEAGLAIDQALLKCAEELQIAHPLLAEELRLINVETRAGKPRIEAFKNFAARTQVEDVRSLVAMLIQTDRFGTSIAQALRTHAEVSRTKRRQRAEEAAAKMGVKLVFPLVFCLFPAFYVVTLGPAVIKFMHAFGDGGFASGVK
jgi:tight adherence protein C